MKRKKRGAALIVVIVVFMFVFTVSMAMLSMVASNYKARVTESKRIENLYASDSGLDVAYNVIGKTFDAATKYANLKVQKLEALNYNSFDDGTSIYGQDYIDIQNDIKYFEDDIKDLENISNDLDNWNKNNPDKQKTQSDIENNIAKDEALIKEDKNLQEVLCNEEFKRAFKNFIKEDSSQLGNHENAPASDQLKTSIDNHEYVSEVSLDNAGKINIDDERIQFGFANKNDAPPTLTAEVSNVSESENQTEGISLQNGNQLSFTVYGQQYYDITVTSDFSTGEVNGNSNAPRQLQATYRMLVPNYKDIYFQNSNGNLNQYLATQDRALTIFGNMNVNNVSGLNVNGDIFVQGSDDNSSSDRVYGKYFGGISLNNSGGVTFEKNVITRGTFNIQNTTTPASVTTDIGGNLYARNVYVGKIQGNNSDLASGKTELTISNQVIINNDLALNADNAKINIGDLYGINDENVNSKAESSSSVIVNGNNNSSINITGSAYLMGTAHIATAGDYQTAESGAIKGNYIAYTIPLTDTEKFKYDDPLQLLDGDQAAKEQHFIGYWNGKNPDTGGIVWPHNIDGSINQDKIWSSGVIVYQDNKKIDSAPQVIPSHYDADLENVGHAIYNERVAFATYAYKFGQNTDINDYSNTVKTPSISLIDTSKIPTDYELKNQQNKGEYAIFNGDNTKEIRITKSADGEDRINSSDPNIINIQVGNNGKLKAVIATAGNVSIESDDITINGCIITAESYLNNKIIGGDLNIDANNVKINYDPEVIEMVEAQNTDTFNAVFGGSIVADTDNNSNNTSDTGDGTVNYNLKNFLEDKLWKINK
ncbi:hypothetical protein [Clostridium sp. BL-8]|uniref:hypothetical protein n=1 Tax=Clostridium sp. BL-8 TaxID=349938 RepID=UPI00098C225B|nr:hypothetical protein [Clostridium sp. BL-8]OOM71674.1 hypothetical protein CLOBL_49160 [Clostridium sp. BL-8]